MEAEMATAIRAQRYATHYNYERMRNWMMVKNSLAALLLAAMALGSAHAQTAAPLKLVKTVTLPGYTGDFDHFAIDRARGRILVAAEDHATLEIFDLKTGNHLRTIPGFGAPHTTLVRPGSPIVLVTDSGPQMTAVLDANTYQRKGSVPLIPGADSAGYDPVANIWYIITGGKDVDMTTASIEAINPDTGKELGKFTFNDNHVEAIALAKNDPRIFINLSQTNKIAVLDRKTMKEIAEWPVPPAKANAMVQFDEAAHRLYVVCRDPGMVAVMNSDTGAVVSTAPAPLRADDSMLDLATHRLYVPGGEGYTGIYDTSDPNSIKQVAKVPTASGAKTGILIPDMHELILAASPGDTKNIAKIMTFKIE
jgi:DNA-binding beta-propeller fold protein YncE